MTVTTTHQVRRSDYVDAMTLTLTAPTDRPAIEWAREIIEHSPLWLRYGLPAGWRLVGMRLAPTHAPDHVHGWPVLVDRPDEVVLGAPSRLGFDMRLSVLVSAGTVRFGTAVRHETGLSRRLWSVLGLPHRVTVAHMMRHAAAG